MPFSTPPPAPRAATSKASTRGAPPPRSHEGPPYPNTATKSQVTRALLSAPSAKVWRAGRASGSGKHLDPFLVERGAAGPRLLHPEGDLQDVVGGAARRLDRAPDMGEQVAHLPGQIGRQVAGAGIDAADHARHHHIADAAGVGDRVLVRETGKIDALSLGHLEAPSW